MLENIEAIRFLVSIIGLLVFPIILTGALIFILRGFAIGNKRRGEAFQRFAQEKGFAFSGAIPISSILGAEYFRLFNLGSGYGRQIENSVNGTINDFRVSIFDYTYYVTFSTKKIHRQTVVMIHSPHLNLPLFSIQPKGTGLFQNLGNNLIEQINSSDKEFSAKYIITGQDLRNIQQTLNHQIISHLKTIENFVIEGGGNRILFYREGMLAAPNQFHWMMQEGTKIAKLLAH